MMMDNFPKPTYWQDIEAIKRQQRVALLCNIIALAGTGLVAGVFIYVWWW